MVKLIIGGDLCPIGRDLPYFANGDAKAIFNNLLEEFHKADLTIANLECPLTDSDLPIEKLGPNLRAPARCVDGIKNAKINVLNLANNHIMDFGPQGLADTLSVCRDAGIETVGAGKNLQDARRILITRLGNIRVGFLGVAEHEFSIATEVSYGANPLGLVDCVRNIRANKNNIDYLVVLLHGGNEHYPYPSPRIRKISRFMVEMGANAVIVQHTHCPGCLEDYQSGHIVYGQGNLILDLPNMGNSFYEGFLVKLSISDDFSSEMDIIPYRQSDDRFGATKMSNERECSFRWSLNERSLNAKDDELIQANWLEFCEKRKEDILNRIFGHNRLLTRLNKYKFFVNQFYSAHSLLKLQNTISCEAHRDVLETLLKQGLL
jgi:poly-gamma-glutamate synthesis protein (capsule biosynthesis protein)